MTQAKKKQRAPKASEEKWGKKTMSHGFCIVPSLLLQMQHRLSITPVQLAIIMQLSDFWWQRDNLPHPGKKKIAQRLGITERTLQRHIADLEAAGWVRRIQRTHSAHGGKQSNQYDFAGLVDRLSELAEEVESVKAHTKRDLESVEKKGLKRRTTKDKTDV